MKNILNKHISLLLTFSMTVIIIMFTSCDNNDDDVTNSLAPVITEIRNYAASPNDTLVDKIVPDQWIVITGKNLINAVEILIDGVTVSFDPGLLSDTYAVVQVPSVISFPSIPESQFNTIKYTTKEGQLVFPFDVIAGPPLVNSVSNENPVQGDVVTITGSNLFLINELTFSGMPITEYTNSNDGTTISFIVPDLAGSISGPVSITTASGSSSTFYNVNDLTTGMLCNFDDIGSLAWGTGTSDSDAEFPGNHGYYPILDNTILSAGEFSWWNGGRSINIEQAQQWVPTADLNLDVDQFAFKFEINVPGDWNGGSIFIVKDYDWTYLARYEPWKLSETKTTNFTTEGNWVTVTIPLTEFRTKANDKDGTGDQPTSLTQLVGDSGNGGINFFTINDSSAPTATGFRGAIDNIRVVKIK